MSIDVAVLGSGFAGLSAASILASKGLRVSVFEKNATLGGRARHMEIDGFVYDMGPSWYWMPEVFEKYFNLFGHTSADFYDLKKLDPSFTVIFGKDEYMDIPDDFEQLCQLFERIEPGAAVKLQKFMREAAYKYDVGINDLVYKPGHSFMEFFSLDILKGIMRLQVFSSFSKHVSLYFKSPKLRALMEFPILFLGAMPKDTPALYSLMNYAGFKLGTWYPMGGFSKVVQAFEKIAQEQGVTFLTNEQVTSLDIHKGKIHQVKSQNRTEKVSAVIGAADYHHIENQLLKPEHRTYSEAYWDQRTFAPSCLIFYLGVNKKVAKLRHHNLFFDEDFNQHATEIYKDKKWPSKPLFYVCCPSKTDPSVAPVDCENIFILMPIATGLQDSEETRSYYYDLLMKRLFDYTGEDLSKHILVKQSYSVANFIQDYHAYKGNAYGLANTLFQTSVFKPKMRSPKVSNLFFAGQLTVPGPGVPPSIISGQVAAQELLKHLNL